VSGCASIASQAGPQAGAAEYCTTNGGVVETRYPFYGTNSDNSIRLAGSMRVCTFTAGDTTRIFVAIDTLYADQPTLAAAAYTAQVPVVEGSPSSNPSSLYCSQLGGTDSFGGVSAAGGGWALEDGSDVVALCVFPDLSSIDSWGLTYHSNGIIRGTDLTGKFRYQGETPPRLFR
jgi:putative hemolysin